MELPAAGDPLLTLEPARLDRLVLARRGRSWSPHSWLLDLINVEQYVISRSIILTRLPGEPLSMLSRKSLLCLRDERRQGSAIFDFAKLFFDN